MSNLTTQESVVELMQSAISESDWNTKADQVKAANNGYPDFWYSAIVLSGLMGRVSARFN
jgi:hypothetical protein